MIAFLRGKLLSKSTTEAIIDCGGVGYGVSMSLSSLSRLGTENSDVQIFVYTHVGQDVLRLFGFVDLAEKQAFEILIGTSGVGPKLALAILSTLSPDELSAVVHQSDKATLTKIPGVGPKKAERLLLELKGRLPERLVLPQTGHKSTVLNDLVSALVNLGFHANDAEKTAHQTIARVGNTDDLTTLVRDALRLSSRP